MILLFAWIPISFGDSTAAYKIPIIFHAEIWAILFLHRRRTIVSFGAGESNKFRLRMKSRRKNSVDIWYFWSSFENIVNSILQGEVKNSVQVPSHPYYVERSGTNENVSCVSIREQFQWMRKAFGSVHRITRTLKNAHRDEAKLPRLPRTSAATSNRYTFAAKAMLQCTRSTSALPLFQIHHD